MGAKNDDILVFIIVSVAFAVILFFSFRLVKVLFRNLPQRKGTPNPPQLDQNTSLRDDIGAVLTGISNSSEEITNQNYESESKSIDQLGLISDMIMSVAPLHESGKLQISVTTRNNPFGLTSTVSDGVLEMYQLLINHTIAIGKATIVRAVLEYHPEFLFLTYFDNGKSNRMEHRSITETLMQYIHHTIRELDGIFEINEENKHGFFATVKVPLIPRTVKS